MIYLKIKHRNAPSLTFIGIGDTVRGATNGVLLSFFREKPAIEELSNIHEVQNMFNLICAAFPHPPADFCVGDWLIRYHNYDSPKNKKMDI